MGAAIDIDAARKSWATLAARAALAGYQLWRSDSADGEQRFFIAKWGMVQVLATLTDVEHFLERAKAGTA